METNYNKLLYEKMQAENETFKDWLLSQEPAEILNHAYEYTIYQDMMLCMGFQAVCIGYMLCKKYGIDTQNFAINRIPEKLAAKESKDIRFELSKMRNAMADIHSRVSDELYRKKQARSKEQER